MVRAFLRQTAALSLAVFVMSIGGRAMAAGTATTRVKEASQLAAGTQGEHWSVDGCAGISVAWPKDIGFGSVEEREAEERLTDRVAPHGAMAAGGTDPRVADPAPPCRAAPACPRCPYDLLMRLRVLRL